MKFDLDNALGYLIETTEQALIRGTRQLFRQNDLDITPYQWVVLVRLWQEDGLTQSDLAARSFNDPATVTRIIDVMERKSLVSRQNDSRDRRVTRVFLTEKGNELQAVLPSIMSDYLHYYTQGIEQEDLRITMDVLRKVRLNATEMKNIK